MVLRGSTSTLVGKAHRHGLRFHKANQPGYALEGSAILGNAARYGAIAGLGFAQAGPRQAIAGPTRWGVAGQRAIVIMATCRSPAN